MLTSVSSCSFDFRFYSRTVWLHLKIKLKQRNKSQHATQMVNKTLYETPAFQEPTKLKRKQQKTGFNYEYGKKSINLMVLRNFFKEKNIPNHKKAVIIIQNIIYCVTPLLNWNESSQKTFFFSFVKNISSKQSKALVCWCMFYAGH